MKKFISIIAVAVGLVSVASAQQYSTDSKTVTNLIAANTTNTVSAADFTCTKNGQVAVTVSSKLTGAGTGASKYVFTTGIDGTTFDGPTFTMNVTQAGTVTASTTSNINIGAVGYVRLTSIGAVEGTLSNIVVKYTIKPVRQDNQ